MEVPLQGLFEESVIMQHNKNNQGIISSLPGQKSFLLMEHSKEELQHVNDMNMIWNLNDCMIIDKPTNGSHTPSHQHISAACNALLHFLALHIQWVLGVHLFLLFPFCIFSHLIFDSFWLLPDFLAFKSELASSGVSSDPVEKGSHAVRVHMFYIPDAAQGLVQVFVCMCKIVCVHALVQGFRCHTFPSLFALRNIPDLSKVYLMCLYKSQACTIRRKTTEQLTWVWW